MATAKRAIVEIRYPVRVRRRDGQNSLHGGSYGGREPIVSAVLGTQHAPNTRQTMSISRSPSSGEVGSIGSVDECLKLEMSGSCNGKETRVMINTTKGASIYDLIGLAGLFRVVWDSTPYSLRLLALPYGLCVYGHFLKASSNLTQLFSVHAREYSNSKVFRMFRPRYHKVESVLRTYGIDA